MMHIPVLQKEILEHLDPRPNENFIDCTIGSGGHATAILQKNGPKGRVLGVEWDPELYKKLPSIKRLIVVNDSYVNLSQIVKREKFRNVAGILFDLGLSSWHLEESGRGFSFKKNEPLDMRYSPKGWLTAEKIVNYFSKFDLEKIFREYGQEKKSAEIARLLVESRRSVPLKTTKQLVKITDFVGVSPQRIFQALRIAVNDELNNLKKALPEALKILDPRGKMAVISFHSLEDRLVKNFFREKAQEGNIEVFNKKPITPSLDEIKKNRRSRSAKLRTAIKK